MTSTRKPTLVGVVHLPPLPGSPRASGTLREAITSAVADAEVLASTGYDYVLLENFGDNPFYKSSVPAVTVSAMTACALAIAERAPRAKLGINVLRNDARSALSIAHVVDAAFVRVNVHIGARVTDQGIIEGEAAETIRLRRALGAERVQIWADVDVKHSAAVADIPLVQEVHDALERGMADALLVTGDGTGVAVDQTKLRMVRSAAPDAKILVASGATVDSLPTLAALADGVIVGSALRPNARAGIAIERARAEAFAEAFHRAFR